MSRIPVGGDDTGNCIGPLKQARRAISNTHVIPKIQKTTIIAEVSRQ
ncbi:MAG: hypothetical protein ACSHYA_04430 [Opitutaceae bacterium]